MYFLSEKSQAQKVSIDITHKAFDTYQNRITVFIRIVDEKSGNTNGFPKSNRRRNVRDRGKDIGKVPVTKVIPLLSVFNLQ